MFSRLASKLPRIFDPSELLSDGPSMEQPNRFQKLVAQAKQHITEISPADALKAAEEGNAVLIDVREEDDWNEGHAKGAKHLSRGVIELDIEEEIPDLKKPIVCYCGGGSRSALVTESLQKMGYENVRSMAGGLRAWKEAGLPVSGSES
ncbi:MAG TPA: rhodanese-like domain-containing protein [Chthoniobacterales bacterium]|nr:rhodanese-like domain-containing protein [Chthoniobacterales bacterium]